MREVDYRFDCKLKARLLKRFEIRQRGRLCWGNCQILDGGRDNAFISTFGSALERIVYAICVFIVCAEDERTG